MKNYLKRYSDQNPERFNKEFILGRKDGDILETVTDIFKTLEVIDEFKVEEVTLEEDESTFGPIKMQHHYYKSVLPSRLDRIHYKIRITPNENVKLGPIEFGTEKQEESLDPNAESFIQEGDVYLNKLVDNCFYINEGVRYFLVYQIVDNATYGVENCVSLKSLLMPITLKQHEVIATPEFNADPITLKGFDVLLFAKKVNPLLYLFGKEAYNSLLTMEIKDPNNPYDDWLTAKDESIISKFNDFFGVDFVFSSDLNDPKFEGMTVFKIAPEKGKGTNTGCYVGVDSLKLKNKDKNVMSVLGSLLDIKNETKKKRLVFSYDDLITPWFWVNALSSFFTKNNDYMKKMGKLRTTLISLNRICDSTTKKILNISSEDKHDTMRIIRYIMRNFDKLLNEDSQNLDNKRLRLHEYQVYPLRAFISAQLYRILNSPTRSKMVLTRALSNLSPTFVIKSTITNELLRYYGASNEINLYTSLLKFSYRGPQSISGSVNNKQRDLTPSQTGRISLISASASDPGLSGSLCPFIEVWDGFFKKQK